MGSNNDDEFHKAVASKNCHTLWTLINRSDQQPYDYEYVVDQLIKNKWILTDVVGLRKLGITKLFFESGDTISVHDVDVDGWTGLHQAAFDDSIDQVKFFLEHNADPNHMSSSHQTPLYCTYYQPRSEVNCREKLEIMKILIDGGAKAIVTMNNISYLQIETALSWGDSEVLEFVLNLDIDLRAHYDESGNTVLHYLARNWHSKVWSKLCGRNFDVNARNDRKETPLWCAINYGNIDAVQFLLSEGADVNAANEENCTPLFNAIQDYKGDCERYKKLIQILIEHGADVQTVSHEVDNMPTVFDVLLEYGDYTLYKLIIEYLALQEAEGMEITELIQSKIDSKDEMKKYFNTCKDLLAQKIYESETLLEFRCCIEEKLISCMRNTDLVRAVNDFCDKLKLQTISYGNWLQKRLDKARRAATLRGSAAIVVSKLIEIEYNGYSFLVDSIIRYLGDEDLNMLLSISL